jgi:hypothetical protein
LLSLGLAAGEFSGIGGRFLDFPFGKQGRAPPLTTTIPVPGYSDETRSADPASGPKVKSLSGLVPDARLAHTPAAGHVPPAPAANTATA